MAEMLTTALVKGNREDLTDILSRVAPEKTPFTSTIGSAKAKATRHEWQIEDLAPVNLNNASLEGFDVTTAGDANVAQRVGNIVQLFQKSGKVANTQEAATHAGVSSDLNHQKLLKGIELRRDKEATYLSYQASQVEAGSNPRKSAGILSWVTTNADFGSGGAVGGYQSSGLVSNAVAGTNRTLTEAMVKGIMQTAFANGAEPDVAMLGYALKSKFSAFAGIAQIRAEATGKKQAVIYAGADVYVSDFGALSIVPHPYALANTVLIGDMSMAAEATYRGIQSQDLAKTGDNTKFLLTNEATLEVKNEKAFGVIHAVT